MPKPNEKEKSFTLLEKDLSIISAVSNPKLSPYLDIFKHYPENVMLQNLGVMTGFFKINDFGEESAYIVNFLSSVLKKEYYANPKRPIENSFDSALQKINLALSEIAKEGNINWLGKIDGAVCVLEKNNLHFSVCGKAKILLIRNQMMSEISADMAPSDAEPNPLKTFVDVSSGRLESGDKIIVCGEDVFRVFSEEEIRKGSTRFKREKFVQFIKTALTNKLELVGAIVVDIFEKEKEEPKIISQPELETRNVFSKKAFEEKKAASQKLSEILKQEENNEYTDEKTGHIYIQEEKDELMKKENGFNVYWFLIKEKSGDAFFWIKNSIGRKTSLIGRSIARKAQEFKINAKIKAEEKKKIKLEKIAAAKAMADEKALADEKERSEREKNELAQKLAEESASAAAKAMADKKASADKERENEKISAPSEIYSDTDTNIAKNESEEKTASVPVFNEPFLARLQKRREELEKQEFEEKKSILASFKKFIPDFGKIKGLFTSFSNKQKLYAAIVILLIFAVPFVFLKVKDTMKANQASKQTEQKAPDARELFSEEKNIVFLDNLEKISDIQNPLGLIFLNEKIIAVNDSKLLSRDISGDTKETAWPENYGGVKNSAPMKDLNLGLFYTDQNKVISFLSATSQFKENDISIPSDSEITGLETYLTYAYFLDSKNSQLYRYPRAEGGFGEKTNWYKDQEKFENARSMAIDENLYLINKGEILKIFKGKIQSFDLEKTLNSFTPSQIFTDSDTQSLYVLDKENGRVIKYSKDGALLSQYFHEDIKNAIDFAVDEKNGKAYLTNSEGLSSFDL